MRLLLLVITLSFISFPLYSQRKVELLFDKIISPHIYDGMVDYASLAEKQDSLQKILDLIGPFNLDQLNGKKKKSFLINVYNILVISTIAENYPVQSVEDIPRFFSRKHSIGDDSYSLDDIEKKLLDTKGDPRLHFALVCGAVSCPPLWSQSFKSDILDQQLDAATKLSLQQSKVLKIDRSLETIFLSRIFRWYIYDFEDLDQFLADYLGPQFDPTYSKKYLDYNWYLNDINSISSTSISTINLDNELRYYASYLYGPKEYEINIFNNYFTELKQENERSNFFTSFIKYTYGFNKRMNFVLELKFRSVTIGKPTYINKWDALRFSNEGSQFIDNEQVSYRQIGFSALTPKIRFQPFKNLPTLTFQHSISIPLSFENDGGFLDWGSPSLYNDLFFDQEVGSKSSFFFQLGVYLENIGSSLVRAANGYYQFSTPMTFIYQHFPSRKTTLYALLNAAPQWGYSVTDDGDQLTIIPDSYSQFGGGIKYFVIDSLQIELLYTKFFTSRIGSQSSTYNFGVRYFGW